MKLSSHLQNYFKYLEKEKDRSPKTLENYKFYLSRFVVWYGENSPSNITADKINKYREWLSRLIDVHGEPLKKNTQNYHLIALRNFLKYLSKNNIQTLTHSKILLDKMPARNMSFIDEGELNKLLDAPLKNQADFSNTNNTGLLKLRDKAILEVLFSTGLRVSELACLKKKDINFKTSNIVIGSSDKIRTVVLSEQAKYWLTNYLDHRHDHNPHLYISHDKRTGKADKNENLTPRSIQRTVQKYARLAGINRQITPQTLRHSLATTLLKNGEEISNVQNILGHSSVTTTQMYDKNKKKKKKQ